MLFLKPWYLVKFSNRKQFSNQRHNVINQERESLPQRLFNTTQILRQISH